MQSALESIPKHLGSSSVVRLNSTYQTILLASLLPENCTTTSISAWLCWRRISKVKEALPASDGRARTLAEQASQNVSDLGSDIQSLSHRLHSSRLEYLRLAAASAVFCREISERQNIEIDFQSNAVPKALPKEISLCLFRVLQEALLNAIKHSGTQRFEVSLTNVSNGIELTVHDSGIGFDPEKAMSGHGLGLTSMKGRLKLVDGRACQLNQGCTAEQPFAVACLSLPKRGLPRSDRH